MKEKEENFHSNQIKTNIFHRVIKREMKFFIFYLNQIYKTNRKPIKFSQSMQYDNEQDFTDKYQVNLKFE